MENAMIEALGRVYAAAYRATEAQSGVYAATEPTIARRNGVAACLDFVAMLASPEIVAAGMPKGNDNG